MINLGLAGFFAVGAYASALLSARFGWPLGAALAIGTAGAAALAPGVALLTARLRERLSRDRDARLRRGAAAGGHQRDLADPRQRRHQQHPRPPAAARCAPIGFKLLFLPLVWGAVLLVGLGLLPSLTVALSAAFCVRSGRTRGGAGRRQAALRFKVQAFALGAGASGLAGALYGQFNAYIAPDPFQPLITIYVLLAVVAGGTGRMTGAVLGAVLVTALTEGTRFLGAVLPSLHPVQVAAVREGVIGAALIALLHLRPEGVLPERVRLHSRP